ncbi:hypothetical protein [Streptomyces sp. NPDC002599]
MYGDLWWREHFAGAPMASARSGAAEDAIEATVAEYAEHLARRTV